MTSTAATSTSGTKTRSKRSVNCWVGALRVCASSTSSNHTIERAIAHRAGRPTSSAPSPLTVPGEDIVALRLLHGHGLAGDGRLVDRRRPVRHDTIHGDAVAGADQHDLADA